jgi:hypothetical protein
LYGSGSVSYIKVIANKLKILLKKPVLGIRDPGWKKLNPELEKNIMDPQHFFPIPDLTPFHPGSRIRNTGKAQLLLAS